MNTKLKLLNKYTKGKTFGHYIVGEITTPHFEMVYTVRVYMNGSSDNDGIDYNRMMKYIYIVQSILGIIGVIHIFRTFI